nr:DnaA/Hda family protein [Paenibacillus prosopidis]
MLNRARANQESSRASGLSSIKTETSYQCQECKDNEGYFVKVEEEMSVKGVPTMVPMDRWVDCKCKRNRDIGRTFKSSKITEEFLLKRFENFGLERRPAIIRSAFQTAKVYADNFQQLRNSRENSICLLGNPGSGKTHLLMAVANELMNQNVKVLYFPWVEGFNEIKDDLSQMDERISRLQKVDVLFIDDMWKGRKSPTEFQIEQAFAIINYRYMEKKPILISSERSIDQMCDIDEALGSRINEMCKDFRIVMKGGRELNYRLREEEVQWELL